MHMLSLYSLGLSSFVQRSIDEGYNGKYILTFFYLSPVLDNINIHCLSGPPECRPKSKEVMNYNYSEGHSFLFSLFYENTTKTWIYQNNPTDKTFGFTFASVYLITQSKNDDNWHCLNTRLYPCTKKKWIFSNLVLFGRISILGSRLSMEL